MAKHELLMFVSTKDIKCPENNKPNFFCSDILFSKVDS